MPGHPVASLRAAGVRWAARSGEDALHEAGGVCPARGSRRLATARNGHSAAAAPVVDPLEAVLAEADAILAETPGDALDVALAEADAVLARVTEPHSAPRSRVQSDARSTAYAAESFRQPSDASVAPTCAVRRLVGSGGRRLQVPESSTAPLPSLARRLYREQRRAGSSRAFALVHLVEAGFAAVQIASVGDAPTRPPRDVLEAAQPAFLVQLASKLFQLAELLERATHHPPTAVPTGHAH